MKKKVTSSLCLSCRASTSAPGLIIFCTCFYIQKLESAQFRVIGSAQPITAVVGQDMVLPCHLSPRMSAENMEVRWFRNNFEAYVHLYRDGRDQYEKQMQEYFERTELLKESIVDGNVPLRILNIRYSDKGEYNCFLRNGNTTGNTLLDLNVVGLGRTAPAVEEVKVTLDPDTAHPHLVLSEDQRSVTRRDTEQHLPDHPQRFTSMWCVLGHQGFTQGRYCWPVEVVWGGSWAVGIARESVRRKGWIFFSPEEGIWGVQRWDRVFWALTGSDRTRLSVPAVPSRIRVYLDCAGRQVRFLNADTEAPIFTFPLLALTGDSVRPWLWAGDTGVQFIFSTAPLTQPCTVPERIS